METQPVVVLTMQIDPVVGKDGILRRVRFSRMEDGSTYFWIGSQAEGKEEIVHDIWLGPEALDMVSAAFEVAKLSTEDLRTKLGGVSNEA